MFHVKPRPTLRRNAGRMLALTSAALSWITKLEESVDAWLQGHATDGLRAAMETVSFWHGPRPMAAAAAVAGVALALRRDWQALWLLIMAAVGGSAVNALIKLAVKHPRPHATAGAPTDFGFPSGHVAWATLLYGTAAALVLLRARRWPTKVASLSVAAALVGVVAISRLVLGAHHVSDVMAAAAGGIAWVAACAWVLHDGQSHRP